MSGEGGMEWAAAGSWLLAGVNPQYWEQVTLLDLFLSNLL